MSSRSSHQRLPRPSTPPGVPPESAYMPKSKLSFGVVCSSNINRSMEAHVVLGNAGLRVESYGTGTQVRLPGRTAMEPRIFKFGTPYEDMYSRYTYIFIRGSMICLLQRHSPTNFSHLLLPHSLAVTPEDAACTFLLS